MGPNSGLFWIDNTSSEVTLPLAVRKWKAFADGGSEFVPLLFGSAWGFTDDIELMLVQYLSAKDLAKLCVTNKGLRRLALLVAAERIKYLVGIPATEQVDVEEIPMIKHFLQSKSTSLPCFLHMVTHCRQQTFRSTLSLGEAHTCVVTMIGTHRSAVFSFGEGDKGQLGNGVYENSVIPHRINMDRFPDVVVASVACGAHHTCILTTDGRILSCGRNNAGQLGDGTRESRNFPDFIKEHKMKDGTSVRYKQIVTGKYYTAALTVDGRVAVFGDGLSVGFLTGGFLLPRGDIGKDEKVVQLAAGQEHLIILTDRNRVFGVGSGHQGKLGLAQNLVESPEEAALQPEERQLLSQIRINRGCEVPRLVATNRDATSKIVHIAAGGNHSALITGDGSLYTWGGCTNGELGLGKFLRFVPCPTLVSLPARTPFALNVSCGKAHTAVLTTCGRILTFGSGTFNQDGKQHKFWATNQPQEICLGELAEHRAALSAVVCGGRHSATQDVSGEVFCFGDPMCTGRPLRMRNSDSNFLPRLVPINRSFQASRRLHSV